MDLKKPTAFQFSEIIDEPSKWSFFREGIRVHWLYQSMDKGLSSALLWYEPGAKVPAHQHPEYEHIFVLKGSQSDEFGTYSEGTLAINPPGSRHSVTSLDGCIVYAVWGKPVEFI